MRVASHPFSKLRVRRITPANNTDAVIIIASDPDESWSLDVIHAGYNATPTAGKLTITGTIGGTQTVFTYYMPAAGMQQFDWDGRGFQFDRNTLITIRLFAAGASVAGVLNVFYR